MLCAVAIKSIDSHYNGESLSRFGTEGEADTDWD